MRKLTVAFLFVSIIVFPACTGKHAIDNLFRLYSLKRGFELKVSESDLDTGFITDKDLLGFIGSIDKYYELSFDSEEGDIDDYHAFVEKLEKILKGKTYSTVLDITLGGRIAAYYRKDKTGNINGFLLIREGPGTSTWLWAPAGDDKQKD